MVIEINRGQQEYIKKQKGQVQQPILFSLN
jgi:hypothetical protein